MTATYLLNKCPTKNLNGKVPEEVWLGKKPSVSHLRVFGSLCYGHVPDATRKKLEDKSKPLILVGYHSTGAYRLYNPTNDRVEINRDVVVLEDESWDWQKLNQTSSQPSVTVILDPIEKGTEPENMPNDDNGSDSEEEQAEPVLVPRPQRQRQMPSRFSDYEVNNDDEITNEGDLIQLAMLADAEPVSVKEALEDKAWKAAMVEELKSIEKNDTWKLTKLPQGQKSIAVKWVFKLKLNPEGRIVKHKARLVAKGFQQREGFDFTEVFSPVARHETIRLVIALACSRAWSLAHLDVKSAFLNGPLEETVYVDQPPGFEVKGKEDRVYKLNKALYGLKQAPRAWNKRIDKFILDLGFKRCTVEYGLYIRQRKGSELLIVCLYVDDLLVTGCNKAEIADFKQQMQSEFEMTDLGRLSYFLGLELAYTEQGLILHQAKYAKDLLQRFKMHDCNHASTPADGSVQINEEEHEEVDPTVYRSIIGSLRYLCHTRPDICYATGLVSRHMNRPLKPHLLAAKRVLRYVKGTLHYGILFPKGENSKGAELLGYSDSDWCGDKADRRSTSGYVFKFNGAPISWSSKKQSIVALSSCEAEYVAGSAAACQANWLESLLEELQLRGKQPIRLLIDNKSAINLAKNPISHGKSKHIETRFHYLRDQVNKQKLQLDYCHTKEQQADILTKAIKGEQFMKLRRDMGLVSFEEQN